MSCEGLSEWLTELLDERLPPKEVAWLEAHLQECSVCAEELALQKEARSALKALPQIPAPGNLLKSIWKAIKYNQWEGAGLIVLKKKNEEKLKTGRVRRVSSASLKAISGDQPVVAQPQRSKVTPRSAMAAGLVALALCGGTIMLLRDLQRSPARPGRIDSVGGIADRGESQPRARDKAAPSNDRLALRSSKRPERGDLSQKKRDQWNSKYSARDGIEEKDKKPVLREGPRAAQKLVDQLKKDLSKRLEGDPEKEKALGTKLKKERRASTTGKAAVGRTLQDAADGGKADDKKAELRANSRGINRNRKSAQDAREAGEGMNESQPEGEDSAKGRSSSRITKPSQQGQNSKGKSLKSEGQSGAGEQQGEKLRRSRKQFGGFDSQQGTRGKKTGSVPSTRILVVAQRPTQMYALLQDAVAKLRLTQKCQFSLSASPKVGSRSQKRDRVLSFSGLTAAELSRLQAEVQRLMVAQKKGQLASLLAKRNSRDVRPNSKGGKPRPLSLNSAESAESGKKGGSSLKQSAAGKDAQRHGKATPETTKKQPSASAAGKKVAEAKKGKGPVTLTPGYQFRIVIQAPKKN